LAEFAFGKDLSAAKGPGPGMVELELIRKEATIERKGALEGVEGGVWPLVEATSP
jgi:hypothetical protein